MSPTASSLARSFLSHLHHHHHRDHQVHSMDGHDPPDSNLLPLLFDRHVSSLFNTLSLVDHQIPFLSLSWLHLLLSSFLLLLDDFPSLKLPTCPSLKSLDLLNAVRDGIDRVRHSRVHLDTALVSLSNNQLHRASKALTLISPEPDVGPTATRHHRSFSLRPHHHHHEIPIRTLSWNVSVSRTWSASRQLSAASVSLSKDALGSVLLFVLWTLVAAVPCQDRGVHAPVSPPRGHAWAGAMAAVQERVLEEYRKKGNENVSGLMKEICEVENGARRLVGMLKAERTEERERIVKEMDTARKGLEGLEGLDRLVREIFLKIVRSRSDGV